MPYTLAMGLLWVVLAVLLGIVIGWLLRSVAARRQVDRARAANVDQADRDELERLRLRVDELDEVATERDRLRAELDAERRRAAATGSSTASAPSATPASSPSPSTAAHVSTNPGEPDLATAGAILGRPVERDDLTVVVGIGPDIAERCRAIGIVTWADLAATEVSLLRTMLADAGPRFADDDPATWPEQASLLAAGAWTEFRSLVDGHRVE